MSDDFISPFWGTPISELCLSVRAECCFKNDQIETIEELKKKSDAELLRIPNFGKKTLKEVKEELARWDKEEGPSRWQAPPPVLPHPDGGRTLKELKGINEKLGHLCYTSSQTLHQAQRSDQLLLQISVMFQYLFEQHTGVSPVSFFATTKDKRQ